jgi:hypothetical protein
MTAVYAACFVAGVLLAVYVMLYGVERRSAPAAPADGRAPHEATVAHDPRSEPRPLGNGQNAAAFLSVFGAAGYLLQRGLPDRPTAVVAGLAAAAGAAAFAVSALLLRAWAIPGARREVVDERYLMQGHPATVTREIPAGGAGEIAYEADGRRWTVPARAWDDGAIAHGAEVAIDRVEGGVAFVEDWAQVEARL